VQSHTDCSRGLNSVSGYLSKFRLVTTARQARVLLLAPYVSYICTAFYVIFELWILGSNVCGLRLLYHDARQVLFACGA
jgi:hypothetical protein